MLSFTKRITPTGPYNSHRAQGDKCRGRGSCSDYAWYQKAGSEPSHLGTHTLSPYPAVSSKHSLIAVISKVQSGFSGIVLAYKETRHHS